MANEHHAPSPVTYYIVFAALMVLTFLTWFVATLDLGWANDVVALTIAVTKALLVLVFFMHLRHSTRVVLTLNDYMTRETLFPILGK